MVLFSIILFLFAILFRTQVQVYPDHFAHLTEKYFPSCWHTLLVLLVHGTFMDSIGTILLDYLVPASTVLTTYFLIFVLLSNFTVLNMLIGIVCEVISRVKEEEQQTSENFYLRTHLLDIMDCYDKDGNRALARREYDLLMMNPEFLQLIRDFGTDVTALMTMIEVFYN